MLPWYKRAYKWLLAGLGGLAVLLAVYFTGRRDRKGEVNLQVATKELEIANAKHNKLAEQLSRLQYDRVDIITDILAEEAAAVAKANGKVDDEEVLKRLRAHGLIK